MAAMKNLVHLGALAMWAVAGVLFTLKAGLAFGALLPVLAFWGWFAAFAAGTGAVVSKLEGPLGALGTHGAALLVLQALPAALPFALARLGLDLLAGRGLPF
ncbi:MAG: hypothetical protein INH41_17545 [Myxococcaceae bacterium]|jgi:hypothetical protein|nr:hypothetical protein [Myxococcaceae bacterium]MCA3014189.1 hypothetical protein [Myxococcaceae bacterium]